MKKKVFKTYNQNQVYLLPPSLDELIPQNHLARVINDLVDKISIDSINDTYKGGGTSSYHPKMLLKVIIYCYINKIYTSRPMAKAVKENIPLMWLAGMQKPCFNTFNNFRSERMKPVIDDVFSTVVQFLIEQKYIKAENVFTDGSKFEANAGKHTYVWAKNVERHKKQIKEKSKELLKEIDKLNEEENLKYGKKNLEILGEDSEITSEKLQKVVDEINNELKEKKSKGDSISKTEKKIEKITKEIETKKLPKLEEYEKKEEILAGRNSFSKTDHQATFMQTKEGLLRAAYNLMISTENQFLMGYSFHQNPGEAGLFKPHIEKVIKTMGQKPENVVADAGLGSEENYQFLEEEELENYVKFNTFHHEQTEKFKSNIFHKDNFLYNTEKNEYTCPNGKQLKFIKGIKTKKSKNNFTSFIKEYKCENCADCEFASQCKKGEDNRVIQVNPRLERYKQETRDNLNSEKGIEMRKRRGVDVEPVFGQIKFNMGFKRFVLRGLDKVNVEFGFVALAHNIKKMHQAIMTNLAKSMAMKIAKFSKLVKNIFVNCILAITTKFYRYYTTFIIGF